MAKKPEAKAESIQAFERFQKLAALALSEEDDEPTEEARSAAVKAIEMLADENGELVVLPRAEVDRLKTTVEGASKAMAQVKQAKRDGMIMGALGGVMLAKSGMLR